jgi:hypothetical protein
MKCYNIATMLLTPHTFVGIAIATAIPNPMISVPISFGMHFLGDMVPHWDFYSNTTIEQRKNGWRPLAVMADLALAVALGVAATTYALWVLHNPALALNIFLCGIASSLPDAITGLRIFVQKEPAILKVINRTQSKVQFQAPLPWGIITQLLVIVVSSLLILDLTG